MSIRASVLDRLMKGKRETANGQGQPLDLPTPEPWPDRVDGAALLSEMTAAIRKYVIMEAGCAEAVALWTLHAHALDAFQVSPRLGITSPEKRCGKTTALDVVQSLAPRPLSTSNTSAAAIFRTIEAAQPTLLIDEADRPRKKGAYRPPAAWKAGLRAMRPSQRRQLRLTHSKLEPRVRSQLKVRDPVPS